MSENLAIKKSAFELDAILFALIGIGIGAYLNYLVRKKADEKIEAKIKDDIDVFEAEEKANKKSNVAGIPPSPYSSAHPTIGGGTVSNLGNPSGLSIGLGGVSYGGIPVAQPNCLTRDAAGNVLLAPCGGDIDLTI